MGEHHIPNGWVLVSTALGWYVERGQERHWLCGSGRSREYAAGRARKWALCHA